MERKKTSLLIIGVFALVLSVIGLTYAFWQLRLSQTDENNIASSCFEVTLEKQGIGIHLDKAYPILDSDGEKLEPYTFTITNTCDAYAGYQINLESLSKSGDTPIPVSDRLDAQYLKVKINEVDTEGMISILGENDVVPKTLNDAYESHKLMTGYLGPTETENASKDFEFRLWLDGDLTMEDIEAMNKKFVSKITVTASYLEEEKIPPTVDLELALCENNITAKGTGTANVGKQITKYEFQLDDTEEWTDNNGELTKKFTGLSKGPHTVKFRVTDNKGITNEISKKIEVNYEEPITATLGGKQIELVNSENGLYKVGHCDVKGTMDDTGFSQEEYRYAGSNPDNYIWFNCKAGSNSGEANCEKWRIIGLVNVITSDNQVEQRLKIIRDESIGNYSWDYKTSGKGSSTSDYGSNDWTDSQLMEMLNDGYYNSSSSVSCYKGSSSSTTCDFTSTGLKESARDMIDKEIIWNIGGWNTNQVVTSDMYNYERGTTVSSNRPTEWQASNTAKASEETTSEKKLDSGLFRSIALPYPSDYGYATSGGSKGRATCFAQAVYNWKNDYADCGNNDWLKPASGYMWTLSPHSSSSGNAFLVYSDGYVSRNNGVFNFSGVLPALYLSSNVKIIDNSNDGSYDSPYELTMNP